MSGDDRRSRSLPLEGLVVADFTRVLAGPICTMVLADLGADVIKIERPQGGDDTRAWGPPFVGDDAAYFLSINRNKRSIALDLSDAEDRSVARDIVARADILVENFRPGVMSDFGLSAEEVTAFNPGLVYCSIPAFTLPEMADMPGYDLLMQAISGFMSVTGPPDGEPVKMGVAILDVVAGLYAAVGILAALRRRDMSGTGERVRVGLFEASVASLVNQAGNYLTSGTIPPPFGNAHPNIVPYQMFSASDGRFVVAAANDKLFRAVCRAIGRPDLADDSRFLTNADRVANRGILIEEMERTFGEETVEQWVARLADEGVPAAPIRTIEDVFASREGSRMIESIDDPVRGLIRVVRSPVDLGDHSRTGQPPPRLGAHDEEIRQWLRSTRVDNESA